MAFQQNYVYTSRFLGHKIDVLKTRISKLSLFYKNCNSCLCQGLPSDDKLLICSGGLFDVTDHGRDGKLETYFRC